MMCDVRVHLVDICRKPKRRTKSSDAKKIEPGPFDLYLIRKSKQKPVRSKAKRRKAPKMAPTAKKKAAKPLIESSDDEISTIGGFVSHSEGESMNESSVTESSYNIRTPRVTRRRNISRNGLLSKKSNAYLSDTDGETVQAQHKNVIRRTKKRDNNKLQQSVKVIVNSLDNCYSSSEPNQWCDISADSFFRQENAMNSAKTTSVDIVPCGTAAKKPMRKKKKQNSTAAYPTAIDNTETGTTQSSNMIESASTAKCHNTISDVSSNNTSVVMLRRLSPTPMHTNVDNISEETACSVSKNPGAQTVPAAEQLVDAVIENRNKPIKKRKLPTKSPKSTKKRNTLSITNNQPPTASALSTVVASPFPQLIRVRPIAELVQQQITPVSQANIISAVPIRKLMPYDINSTLICKVVLEPLTSSQNVTRFHAPAVLNNPVETAALQDESLIEPEIRQTVSSSPYHTNREEIDIRANSVVTDVGTEATSAATDAVIYETTPLIDEDAENDAEIEQINRNHDSDSDHFPENHYSSDSATSGMNTNPRSPQQSPISPFAFDNAVNAVGATEVYPTTVEPPQNLICIAIDPTQEPSINALDLSYPNSSRCRNNNTISSTIRSSPLNSGDDRHICESENCQNQSSNTTIQQHPLPTHRQSPQDPIPEATTESTRIHPENGDETSMETLEIIEDIVSPEYEEHISPISPVAPTEPMSTLIRRRRSTSFIPQRVPRKLANNVITLANVTPLKPKAIGVVSEQRVTSSQEDLIAFATKAMECHDNDLMISSTIYTLGDENYKKRQGIGSRRFTTIENYTVQGKPN